MKLFTMCWTCFGKGYEVERDRIPNDQLTPEQNALRLIEGGYYYTERKVTCTACGGTGSRK